MSERSPEQLFFEADRLIEADQIAEAMALLEELVRDHPDFGKAYNHLGFVYETKYKDPARAEHYYRMCLDLSPDYPAVYLNYAILLNTQERFEELEALLQMGLECPGINKPKLYNEFGIMYEIQGQYEQAIQAYGLCVQYAFLPEDIERYKASVTRVRDKQAFMN